jgi:hypothetical protein
VSTPTISLQSPAPGASGVSANALVSFRLQDAGLGVDLTTVRVVIRQGDVAWVAFEASAFVAPCNGPGSVVTPVGSGFDLAVDNVNAFWQGTVQVEVEAENLDASGTLTTSWSFAIAACVPEGCTPLTELEVAVEGPWGLGAWGEMPWGGAGTYTFAIAGGGAPLFGAVGPVSGLTTGGTDFVLTGTNLACFAFNDRFHNAVVDPVLWAVIGGGTVSEGPFGFTGRLKVATGAAAGQYAGVYGLALTPRGDFHLEVEAEVKTPFLVQAQKPPSEVVLAALEARIDDGNRLVLSYVMTGPTATTGTLRCEVWKYGVRVHVHERALSASVVRLGLMRYSDPVFNDQKAVFWLNGTKVFEAFDAPACTCAVRLYALNKAAAYNVETWFGAFVSHSVVVFVTPNGCDVATNLIEVTTGRIRGKSPPSVGNWAGATTLRITNGSGNGCAVEAEEAWGYTFPEAFVVGRSQPYRPTQREVSFTNDSTLRNPGPNLGLNQRRQ